MKNCVVCWSEGHCLDLARHRPDAVVAAVVTDTTEVVSAPVATDHAALL